MKKQSSPYEVPNDSYSSYFGIIFKKIKYETFSAHYISTIYKILTITFYLFSRVQKEVLKIPTHIIQKNIYQAIHAGHIYGMFYYHKCDRQWIEITCKKNNISPTEKILFGFSGVFKTKKRVFSLDGIPWFEKSIFILFSSLILSNSLFLLLYSFFIILAKSSLQNTLGLIISWMLYTYICFIIIQIIKGSCWDANNLFKKYR